MDATNDIEFGRAALKKIIVKVNDCEYKEGILFTMSNKMKNRTVLDTVLEPKFFTARKRRSYYTVSIKSNKKQKKTDLDFV